MQYFDHFFKYVDHEAYAADSEKNISSLRLCVAAPDSWNLFQDGWSLKNSAAWSQPRVPGMGGLIHSPVCSCSTVPRMIQLNLSTRNRCYLIDALNWEISFFPSWLVITISTSMLLLLHSFFLYHVFLVLSVPYQLKVVSQWTLDRLWPTSYPLKKAHNEDCIS